MKQPHPLYQEPWRKKSLFPEVEDEEGQRKRRVADQLRKLVKVFLRFYNIRVLRKYWKPKEFYWRAKVGTLRVTVVKDALLVLDMETETRYHTR